jgi:hypothetical protein
MHFRTLIAVTAGLLITAVAAASAQDVSKYPDWSGQWRRPSSVAPAWDPTKPPGLGQQAPLTPEYQAIFEATLKDRATGGLGGDPTGLCLPHGMPRMMVAIFPIEFVVTPKITYYMTDYTTSRRIFTDGRDWPRELLPSFNGYSIGKWVDEDGDGKYDVLEIESRGFRSPRSYEATGLPLHDDGASVITERIFIDKADKDILHDVITVNDHALTRPWTVDKRYKRDHNPVWYQLNCSEDNRHVYLGNEHYVISADDKLMPSKKDQAPPDLSYFKTKK